MSKLSLTPTAAALYGEVVQSAAIVAAPAAVAVAVPVVAPGAVRPAI